METNRTLEIIRNEIERLKSIEYPCDNSQQATGFFNALDRMTDFLDTLESEKPINPEDAMKELNEKIALVKERGTWEGVDVDSYMDEVRERVSDDLEEAAKVYFENPENSWQVKDVFIAGSEWRYQKDRAEFAKLKAKEWSDGYNEGIVRGKEQMVKEAEECELYWDGDFLAIDLNMAALGYSERDKVSVIVLKKEDEK